MGDWLDERARNTLDAISHGYLIPGSRSYSRAMKTTVTALRQTAEEARREALEEIACWHDRCSEACFKQGKDALGKHRRHSAAVAREFISGED